MIKISDTAKSRIAQLMTDEGFNVAFCARWSKKWRLLRTVL